MAKRGAHQKVFVGQEIVIETDSEDGIRGVVFEDDGRTGYFYARDYGQDMLFVDALHIYSVEGVVDKDKESTIDILWTDSYEHAVILINNYPHAVFNFPEKKGYSRDMFPAPDPKSGWSHHKWDDSLRNLFFMSAS